MTDKALDMLPGKAGTDSSTKTGMQTSEATLFWQVNLIVGYYLFMMLAAFWLFLDTWTNHLAALSLFGLGNQIRSDPLIPSIVFVITGGIFGSVLYNIRVLFRFYLKTSAYNYRWLAKYISAPLESAAMALVVLALIQGGLALLGGSPAEGTDPTSRFASFGIGSLVGFGMRDVVGWISDLVRTMFVSKDD